MELVSNGVAMLANGPDKPDGDAKDGGDISGAPYEAMKDVRLAGAFYSHAGGAVPVNSNAMSWNADMVTITGNVMSTCCTTSIWSAGHGCTSCGSTRRSAIQRVARSAAIFSSVAPCTRMPMP